MLATLTTRFARLGTMVGTVVVLSTVLAPAALAQDHVTAPPHISVPAPRPALSPGTLFRLQQQRPDALPATSDRPLPAGASGPARAPDGGTDPNARFASGGASLARAGRARRRLRSEPAAVPALAERQLRAGQPGALLRDRSGGHVRGDGGAARAAMTPGWGTAVLNGPQGNGVYLTQQGSASGG